MVGAKAEFFLSLNKKYVDEEDQMEREVEDRDVFFWLDKSRYRGRSNTGTKLFFGEDGNFYQSQSEAIATYDRDEAVKMIRENLF